MLANATITQSSDVTTSVLPAKWLRTVGPARAAPLAARARRVRLRRRGLRRRRLERHGRARARPQLRPRVGRAATTGRCTNSSTRARRRGVSLAHVESVARARRGHGDAHLGSGGGRPQALGAQEFDVPIRARTRMFGTLVLPYRLRITQPRRHARGGLAPIGLVPGPAPWRAADPHHQPAAPGHAAGAATAACWPNRRRAMAAKKPARATRPSATPPRPWSGRVGAGARRPAGGTGSGGRAAAGAGRPQRPGAGVRRTPARNAGGRAAGGRSGARLGRSASGAGGAHEHLPHAAAGGGGRARRRSTAGSSRCAPPVRSWLSRASAWKACSPRARPSRW